MRKCFIFLVVRIFPPQFNCEAHGVACVAIHRCNKTLQLPNGDHLDIEQKDNGTQYKSQKPSSKFYDNIDEMRNQEMLCDITLVADHTEVHAHKLILAATSLFFYTMFSGLMGETGNRLVLDGVHRFALPSIINYIYTGEIFITQENVEFLLRAAHKLSIEGVFNACVHFLGEQLNIKNCFHIASLAREFGCVNLLDEVDLLVHGHFGEIVESEEYLELSHEHLARIIKSDVLKVSNEIEVFNIVLTWIKHKVEIRGKYLASLMQHVRFPLMSLEDLIQKVEEEPLIEANAQCRSYLREARKYHLMKGDEKSEISGPRIKPRFWLDQKYMDKIDALIKKLTTKIPKLSLDTTTTEQQRDDHPDEMKSVLVAVGRNEQNILNMERYDFEQQQWLPGPQSFHKLYRLYSILLNTGDKVYMIGGYGDDEEHNTSVDVYIARLEKWIKCNDLLIGRDDAAATVLNGNVYVSGGYANGKYLKSCEKLDMKTKRWVRIGDMMRTRSNHSMCTMYGNIYACGGMNGTRAVTTVECYTPGTNKWRCIYNMSIHNILSPGIVSLDGKLYCVGGQNENGWQKSVTVYDYWCHEEWAELADLTVAQPWPSVVAANGHIYVMGRCNKENADESIEVYDPRTDTWTMLPNNNINVGKQWLSAAVPNWPS